MADNYVRLLKNHIYPTFQLYAQMENKKTNPKDGLMIGALTTLEWLKNRMGDDCPDEIRSYPGPDDYEGFDRDTLKSFHQNSGYVIDIVSNPDDGEWSLQISEPDLGSDPGNDDQKRQAVPGRVFFTDISFKIVDAKLHCGFRTMISDPDGTEKAAVYRLVVVRKLAENPAFGLRQAASLQGKAYRIKNKELVQNLIDSHCDKDNQMPIVVFAEKEQSAVLPPFAGKESTKQKKQEKCNTVVLNKKIDTVDLSSRTFSIGSDPKAFPLNYGKDLKAEFERTFMEKAKESLPVLEKDTRKKPQGGKVEFDPDAYANYLLGIALVYAMEQSQLRQFKELSGLDLQPGDLLIWEPVSYENRVKLIHSASITEEELEQTLQYIHDWPRDKEINYDPVTFLSSTRQHLFDHLEKAEKEVQNADDALKLQLQEAKNCYFEELQKKDEEVQNLKAQLGRQKEYAFSVEKEKSELRSKHQEEQEKKDTEIRAKEEEIAFLKRKLERPREVAGIPEWVKKHFDGKLLLHDKAVDMLKSKDNRDKDVDLICDALEYLALEYRDSYFKEITEDQAANLCSLKYGRRFDFSPVSSITYDSGPLYNEYHVKYTPAGRKNDIDAPLDKHIRYGNTDPWLVRVYYFVDEPRKLIVVGSLPKHLGTVTFG